MTSPIPGSLNNELYAHLSEDVQQELANHEQTFTISPGTSLVRYGVPSNHLIILNSGSAEISVPCTGKKLLLGIAGPGKVLALHSILSGEPPPTSVISNEECEVTLIPKEAFLSILRKNPKAYLSIVKVLSTDLAHADRVIRTHRRSRKSNVRMTSGNPLPVI